MLRCRVDDFPGTKPEEFWRHNLDNFRRFNDVMAAHGFDYVLGVIPKHTSDAHLRALAQMNVVEVAMHGVRHNELFPDEFHLETEKEIGELLISAKAPLDEICGPVEMYIPPHNVISAKTLVPLVRAGFKEISGGPGSDPDVLSRAAGVGLKTYYCDPPLQYGRSDELMERGAVEFWTKQNLNTESDRWLALHWTWEWNIGLENLDRFLTKIQSVINFGRMP